MKTKFGSIKLEPIQELNKAQQKEVKGGGGANSPCCPSSPYFNASSCQAYAQAMGCSNVPPGSIWCSPSWGYEQAPNGICRR